MLADQLQMLAQVIRDDAIAFCRAHEEQAHAGAVCWKERLGLIAFLCHSLGLRGPGFLWELDQTIDEYDARCSNTDCRHDETPARPRIVCLTGVADEEQLDRTLFQETIAGNIAIGHYLRAPGGGEAAFVELRCRMIDRADEVLVINPGGFISAETAREIEYAVSHGKPVRWQETQ